MAVQSPRRAGKFPLSVGRGGEAARKAILLHTRVIMAICVTPERERSIPNSDRAN